MSSHAKSPKIPLSKDWGNHVKSAILYVIAVAQYALTYSRSLGGRQHPMAGSG